MTRWSTPWTRTWSRASAMAAMLLTLTACFQESDDGPTLRVQTGAAAITGARCTLTASDGRELAAAVSTDSDGSATFVDVQAATGLGLVSCSGGQYTDIASGARRASTRLRGYTTGAPGAADSPTVVVTPLTEMAVRLLGGRSAESGYETARSWIAGGFGLGTLDIGSVPARNLTASAAADDAASRYGLVLAALSQLEQTGTAGSTPDAWIGAFAANVDDTGFCKDMTLPMAFARALESVLDNRRVSAQLSRSGVALAREIFDKAMHAEPLATIHHVDANPDAAASSEEPDHVIAPGQPATLAIGGRWLYLGLEVRLDGGLCRVFDLETTDHETSTGEDQVSVQCPARPAGKSLLVVKDSGVVVHQTELTVAAKAAAAERPQRRAQAFRNTGTGPVTLSGTVTAVAPTVDTTTGAHNYAATRTFAVKGVVVELLDRDANHAVLLDTATDGNGQYTFRGVDANRNVTVRVKAQLLKTRDNGATTGAQWNIAVRDNTSTSTPKALYVLDSAPVTTAATGQQVVDLVAPLGFGADGSAGADEARKSAPFSILEVAYSAMTKIEQTDPNVVFPEVNFYWSPKNVGTGGNKEQGQISTSHYADSGPLPGLFILGKADADTDEFDQGVIGHEMGHWLQSVLSSSDNPGGSHAVGDFKDASLAFGEGYGTAVGALLSGSPYYIDTSGDKQSRGGVTNLEQPSPAGARKGFYAEESVQYVMYQIGKRHGFTAFWNAVTALKADHHSSTIFAFLAKFRASNPAAAIDDLLVTENIRSSDPLGKLAGGVAPDPAISAEQNKGQASAGAADLETLYLPVTLASAEAGAAPAPLTPSAPPSFCINHNLKGAQLSNGLGMLRRFVFTANYTGSLGIRFSDDKGAELNNKDVVVTARSSRGAAVQVSGWDNAVQIAIEQGTTYTVLFQQTEPNVFQGNRCGNTMTLWRLPA